MVLVYMLIWTDTNCQNFSFNWKLGPKCEKQVISKKVGQTQPAVTIANPIWNLIALFEVSLSNENPLNQALTPGLL